MQSNTEFMELKNVSKQAEDSYVILNDINLSFPHSGLFFLYGKSNSGKTTLLSILSGLDRPTSGQVLFCRTSIYEQKQSYLDSYRNEMIAFLSQNDILIDSKTVYENIALSYQSGNRIPDREEIQNTLALLNIENIDSFLNRKASSLSASEKEKVRIAEGLVRNTKILLIDGLSSSLDTESEKNILEILKSISEKRLVILSGHQPEIIKPYANGLVELSDKTCKETHFEETGTYDPEEYKVKKGHHLSISASFRFALSFLNSKKLSVLFSFLITFFTILSSGLSLISLVDNPTKIQIQELYRENIQDVILHQDSFLRIGLYPDSKRIGGFTDRQKEAIKSHTKQKELIDVYEGTFFRSKNPETMNPTFRIPFDYSRNLTFKPTVYENSYEENYKGYPNGFMELSEANLDYAGFVLDPRLQNKEACHHPQSYDEIAITSFKANLYLEYGYKDNDGNVLSIHSVDDLIGKKLDDFTITAIYQTTEDMEFSRKHSYLDASSIEKRQENDIFRKGTYISNYLIVPKGTLEHYSTIMEFFLDDISVYYKLPENQGEVYSLLKDIRYKEKTDFGGTWFYQGRINSPLSYAIENVTVRKFSVDYVLFLVMSILFVLFDILLLSKLVSSSLRKNEKTLASLLSSGARKKDLDRIRFMETGLICLVNLFLPIPLFFLICGHYNQTFFLNYFSFGLLSFFLLLLVDLGIIGLSALLSIYRHPDKKKKE